MTVVITGASRGIGQALAQAYTARGCDVVGTTRDGTWALDVADPVSLASFGARMYGWPVELLVCNAGVYLDKGAQLGRGYSAEFWAQSFAVNVTGVFLTIETLIDNLRAAKRPRVAIISSQMGSSERAPGGSYIYSASKAAALNLGRNLAKDLASDGIAVGIYHPGWVKTDMGGQAADLTLQESVSGLMDRFDALDLAASGQFLTWDGRLHPY